MRGLPARRAALGAVLTAAMVAGGGLLARGARADDGAAAAVATSRAWVVIVHPSNPLRTIDRAGLEKLFRRRTRFWGDGRAVVAVNLPGDDPLRHAFDAEVLRSSGDQLAMWWNREYFQGVTPPAVMQSSAAVRAFVAATPTAIGYVEASAIDASVAVVELRVADPAEVSGGR